MSFRTVPLLGSLLLATSSEAAVASPATRRLSLPLSPAAGIPVSMAQADFDGDGRLDLAIGRGPGGRSRIEIHPGADVPIGTDDPPFLAPSPGRVEMPFEPTWLVAADLDDDGRVDLAAVAGDGGEWAFLRGCGDGRFDRWQPRPLPAGRVIRLLEDAGAEPGTPTRWVVEIDGPSGRSRAGLGGDRAGSSTSGDPDSSTVPLREVRATALARFWDGDAFPDRLELRDSPPRLEVTTARPNAIFTVTSTADAGAGTLRQAILDAEALPGLDTIVFAIGTGPQTIAVLSPLPPLADPVTIDGSTQPGYSGTPLVEIDGALAGPLAVGLAISAGGSTVRALAVNRFDHAGIEITGPGGCRIEGNFVGVGLPGNVDRGNLANGIAITDSPNNVVGGTAPGAGNVASGNEASGLEIVGPLATGNRVEGNRFGTTADGLSPLPNAARGARIREATGNILGGAAPGAGNLISGNALDGVELRDADANFVLGNRIGTDVTGQVALPNGGGGIRVRDASTNRIGGTAARAGNVLSGNLADGLEIRGSSTGTRVVANRVGPAAEGETLLGNGLSGILLTASGNLIGIVGGGNRVAGNGGNGIDVALGTGNALSENALFGNGGLGIDLGLDGVTPNDAGDGDAGANDLQNFPVLSAATCGLSTVVEGTLSSTPSATFSLEFFASAACDPSGNGEAERFLGAGGVTTDGSGAGSFSVTLAATVPPGNVVTATATRGGSTSELSSCRVVVGSAPGEVAFLNWSVGSEDRLAWSPVAGAAGYELFRGNAASLPGLASGAIDSCRRWGGAAPDSGPILTEAPGVDGLLWYLVVAVNGCGRGGAGGGALLDSAGPCAAPLASGE